MKSKQDMKSKFLYFGLIINAKKESLNPEQELRTIERKVLSSNDFTATIIHDKDLLENGQPKLIHLHAYIEKQEKATIKAILNEFTQLCDISAEQVSVEGSNNSYLLVQYLTHKNHKEKHQYDIGLISTNNKDLLLQRYEKAYQSQQEESIEILNASLQKSFIELISQYGFDKINKLRPMIKDIRAENIKLLQTNLNHLTRHVSDLVGFIDNLLTTLDNGLTKESKNIIGFADKVRTYENIQAIYTDFKDNR